MEDEWTKEEVEEAQNELISILIECNVKPPTDGIYSRPPYTDEEDTILAKTNELQNETEKGE